MSVHDGHRQRMRERFIIEGLDGFQEVNVLELLLFYCFPRIDTNEIAHRLLDEFGSFPNVLEASIDDLKKVKGVGENAATFLSILNATNRYYRIKKTSHIKTISCPEQYISVLEPLFTGIKNERLYMLCLDAKSKIITCKLLGEGVSTGASVSVRKIMETALSVNATSVVMAHNHPDGCAVLSQEDKDMTCYVARALRDVEIELIDHVVFADSEHISFALDSNYRDYLRN